MMQAVILAGGLGTRLRPMTNKVPKPMIPIHGRPYLAYQIEYLKKQNIDDIVLLVGYLGNQIIDYFGDGSKFGVNIQYSIEPIPLGTGGGIKNAKPYLKEDFFVIYGDSFLPLNYKDVVETYIREKNIAMMCVYDNIENTDVISNIAVDTFLKIIEYAKNVQKKSLRYVDAGVLVFNKQIFDYMPTKNKFSLEEDLFPTLIDQGYFGAYVTSNRFFDIGTPARLKTIMEVLI